MKPLPRLPSVLPESPSIRRRSNNPRNNSSNFASSASASARSSDRVSLGAIRDDHLEPTPSATRQNTTRTKATSVASGRARSAVPTRFPAPDYPLISARSFRRAYDAPGVFIEQSLRTPTLETFPMRRHQRMDPGLPSFGRPSRRDYSRLPEAQPLTLSVSSNFTQKFPLPRSISYQYHQAESRGDNNIGFESCGQWTIFKWILLLSVLTVRCFICLAHSAHIILQIFGYGLTGFILTLLTWFKSVYVCSTKSPRIDFSVNSAWEHADVVQVADPDILACTLHPLSSRLSVTNPSVLLMGTLLLVFTSLLGLAGTLLNSRPILAFYALLLFPSLLTILIAAYTAFKRANFSLDLKLNLAWSEWYSADSRLVIQNSVSSRLHARPSEH